MNGCSHSMCHGQTTGARKSDPAIGQANVFEDHSGCLLLIQVTRPTSTASAATTCGVVTRSSVARNRIMKRHVLYDTGHHVPRSEMIKETLNWLDRYLGPVK